MLLLRQFLQDERGATVIEYGLIVALLSLAIVGGVGKASSSLQALFAGNESKLAEAFRTGQ
jgi:pilus assembly protein Flp/PilA